MQKRLNFRRHGGVKARKTTKTLGERQDWKVCQCKQEVILKIGKMVYV